MKLLIDAGNSRVKWAIDGPDYWSTGASTRSEFAQSLKDALHDTNQIDQIVASSTRNQNFNQQLSELIKQVFDKEIEFIKPQRRHGGVVNRYEPVTSLGADRWSALIAARSMSNSPAIVIDCGTAVTVDALNADGIFEGGVIFPGLTLSLSSLNQTDNLPIAEQVIPTVFAKTTDQAMYSGVLYSIASGIDGIVQQMRKSLGYTVNIYLTGGDAKRMEALLDHHVIVMPDMVLRGVKLLANNNQ